MEKPIFEYFRINDNEVESLRVLFMLKAKTDIKYDFEGLRHANISFLGKDGWELVGIIEHRVAQPELIFKRPSILAGDWVIPKNIYEETLNEVRKDSRKFQDLKYMTKNSKTDSGSLVI